MTTDNISQLSSDRALGQPDGAFVIVVGNEKGGSGKSTTAMHIIVALLRMGFSVGSIDLDVRQQTLSHYVYNRKKQRMSALDLPTPTHAALTRSENNDRAVAELEEEQALSEAIMNVARHDFIVIDTPGSDSNLSRSGHTYADVLVTPVNDSFVDLDLLVELDGPSFNLERPSCYAEMVFEQKKLRLLREQQVTDWVVLQNRLSHLTTKNNKFVGQVLERVAKRQGFRLVPGFGERVIYRELFLRGLTLLDVCQDGVDTVITMSHVSARAEVRALLKALNLPNVGDRVSLL